MEKLFNPNEMNIKVTNLAKCYGGNRLFDDVSFEINRGEKVVVTGSSGCGKTTLLRILAGLEEQDAGEIHFKSVSDTVSPDKKRERNLMNIAWIPQDLGLWPNLSVYQNVALAYQRGREGTRRRAVVLEALEQCQIIDMKKRKPARLSAGEQQRVALARALVSQPTILLLDEPFASLDIVRRKHFFEVLKGTWTENLIVIVVTHDPFDAIGLGAGRVMVIEDGGLKEDVNIFGRFEGEYRSKTLQVWGEILHEKEGVQSPSTC
jgi:iron(III) transport system ATP-binding protein